MHADMQKAQKNGKVRMGGEGPHQQLSARPVKQPRAGECGAARVGGKWAGRQVWGAQNYTYTCKKRGQCGVMAKEEPGHEWSPCNCLSVFLKSGRGYVPHNIQKKLIENEFPTSK